MGEVVVFCEVYGILVDMLLVLCLFGLWWGEVVCFGLRFDEVLM